MPTLNTFLRQLEKFTHTHTHRPYYMLLRNFNFIKCDNSIMLYEGKGPYQLKIKMLKNYKPTCGEEIRRTKVQDQPRQKHHKTPSQPMSGHGDSCLSSQLCREAQIGWL
jgi:GH43 family beta-xylosidase